MLKFNKEQNKILLRILNRELQVVENIIKQSQIWNDACIVGMSPTEKHQTLNKKRINNIIKKIEAHK